MSCVIKIHQKQKDVLVQKDRKKPFHIAIHLHAKKRRQTRDHAKPNYTHALQRLHDNFISHKRKRGGLQFYYGCRQHLDNRDP